MREILFKAKRIDNGEWVEGTPVFYKDGSMTLIDVNEYKSVGYHILNNGHLDRNTLCQYTGLTDKNGNKIWENDLIEVKKGKSHFISQIEWDDWCKGFMFQDTKTTACGMDALSGSGCYHFDYEVIGNIFDNPELVEGGV